MSKFIKYLPVIFLILITAYLRFANLGYSDYQGDEIKAFYLPSPSQTLTDFLIEQRKGPTQFIITYVIKIFDPVYENRFLTRVPFAIASFLAVIYFYKFVGLYFSQKTAFYSAFLFSVNGLFVAFGRIVQYQAFVILFSILALYFFSLSLKEVKWRIAGIYYGMAAWGLAILTHYDGIFIAPFVIYILINWYLLFPSKKHLVKLMHLFLAGLIPIVLLSVFYIPFIQNLSAETIAYWNSRLEGGGGGKISSSIVTFKLYNPKFIYYLYIVFIGLYIFRVAVMLLNKKVGFFRFVYFNKDVYVTSIIILFWALIPFIFMELVTSIPGTHIYTYILPLTIIVALGISSMEIIVKRLISEERTKIVNPVIVSLLFIFMSYLSVMVFIDNKVEYPWEEKQFLFWTLPKPNLSYHLSIFGFPYYRNWNEIGRFVSTPPYNGWYSTNERDTISRLHTSHEKDTTNAGHFILIKNPQSYIPLPSQEKAEYWVSNFTPVHTIYNNDDISAEIYYMPEGKLEEALESANKLTVEDKQIYGVLK